VVKTSQAAILALGLRDSQANNKITLLFDVFGVET